MTPGRRGACSCQSEDAVSERDERDWHVVSLADVSESVRYGYTASASADEIGPKFLRITDIVPQTISWHSVPYCEVNERDLQRYLLQTGDIVIARTGATVGYAKQIRTPENAVFASYLVRFRIDSEIAEPRFIGHIVESTIYKKYVKAQVGGAAQPNANAKVLGRFSFTLPPRRVQRRIADVLSAYDDLIENNRRRIALLEQAARELYREWFVRLRFPGHENTKIANGLPKGWSRIRLSDIVSTQYGYTESAREEPIGPKFVRGTDINKNAYIDWDTVPFCPVSETDFGKYALRPGDLLVVRMADPGKVAIVEKPIQAVFASYLVRLQIHDQSRTIPLYLFYALAHERYQGFIRGASGGSTRKSASAKLLTDFVVVQPPIEIQILFVELVAPLRKMIGTLIDQNAQANASRDVLLPRLMSGEVVV